MAKHSQVSSMQHLRKDLRIIFITRAQPRNYGKRLQGQLDTWMNDLPREDLFITSFTLPADKPLSEKDRQSVMEPLRLVKLLMLVLCGTVNFLNREFKIAKTAFLEHAARTCTQRGSSWGWRPDGGLSGKVDFVPCAEMTRDQQEAFMQSRPNL